MVSSEASNSSSSDAYQQTESMLSQHFVQAHGVLQNLESELKQRLRERRDALKDSVEAFRDELCEEEDKLAMAYAMAITAREKPDKLNLRKLTEKLLDLADSPCHLMANDAREEYQQPRMEANPEWIEQLRENHVRLLLPETQRFSLLRAGELPDDYELESIESDENLNATLRCSFRRDSASPSLPSANGSSPANQSLEESANSGAGSAPIEPSSITKGNTERARITCFTDPTDFYVLKTADERMYDELQHVIDAHVAKDDVEPPADVELNSLYIVQNSLDLKWYRGRVTRVYDDEDEGRTLCDVYYVDLGASDHGVTQERMRQLADGMRTVPGLAMHCTLEEIVPVDGQEWGEHQLRTITDFITGQVFVMTVLSSDGFKSTVELKVSHGTEEQKLREWLVVTGLAKINSFQKLKRINPKSAHQFYYEELKMDEKYVKVTVMNVVSPHCIYVRNVNGKQYFHKIKQFQSDYARALKTENLSIRNAEIGDTVALLDELNYHRGYITNVIRQKSKFEVFLVDTGETKIAKSTQITRLPSRFCDWTARAIQVYLVDIEPVEGGTYTEAAIQYLRQHLTEQTVKILAISKSGNAYGVAMITANETNVNANLVSSKFAASTGQYSKHATLNNDISAPAKPRKKQKSKANSKDDSASEKLSLRDEQLKAKANKLKLPGSKRAEEADAFRVRVDLHKVISPNEIYVSETANAAAFEVMNQQLQKFYSEHRAECRDELEAGIFYCVYSPKDRQYCRAMFAGMSRKNPGRAVMSLIDLAEAIEVERDEVQPLNARFLEISKHIFRIKLAGVSPCGGSKTWPSSSCRKLKEIVEGSGGDTKYYITLAGSAEEDEIIPVDLLLRRSVPVGPTEPSRRENVSVKRRMIEDGHAFPIQGYDDDKEKELAVELKKKLKLDTSIFVDDTAGTSKNNLTPIEEEAMMIDGEAETDGKDDEVAKDDDREVENQEEENDCEVENAEDVEKEDEETSTKNTSGDSTTPPPKVQSWIPAAHLVDDELIAKVTYIGYNGEVYFHPDTKEYKDTLKYIMETLDKEYRNKPLKKYDYDWEVGDLCIAKFHIDNKWYRAVVTAVNSKHRTVTVKFVDYGNVEDCEIGAVKKRISLTDIPIQTTAAEIVGLKPMNGKWEVKDLDVMHKVIVEKRVKVKILSKPPKPWKAQFWMIDGDMPVSVPWYIRNKTQVKCIVENTIIEAEDVELAATDSTVQAVVDDSAVGFFIRVNDDDSDDSSDYESLDRKSFGDVSDAEEENSGTIKNGDDVDSENTVRMNRSGHSSNGEEKSSSSSNTGRRRRSASIDSSDTSPNASDELQNGNKEEEEDHNGNQEKLLSGNSIYFANDLDVNFDIQSVRSEALNSEINFPLVASTPLNTSLSTDDIEFGPKDIDFFSYKLRQFQMSIGTAHTSTKMSGHVVDCPNEDLRAWIERVESMKEEIQACAEQQPLLPIREGAIGIAQNNEDKWYRAQIIDISDAGITVEFIDKGEWILYENGNDIRTAKKEWLEAPRLSFTFKFYNVKAPKGRDDAAFVALAKILSKLTVLTAVIKVYEQVLGIELYLDENCKQLAYSTLIKDGLFEVIDPEVD